MSLWDTVGEWIDTGADFVAEAIGYTDEVVDTLDDTGTLGMTAGDYLLSDVKDSFGFITKGLDAYRRMSGMDDKTGKDTGKQMFQAPTARRTTAASALSATRGSRAMTTSPVTGNPVGGRVGYNNPSVQTALTALIQNSYNQQMNNMFAQYLVSPTKRVGQGTVSLASAKIKGVTKKQRKTRGRNTA